MVFSAPLAVWLAFTIYFAGIGFGMGFAVSHLRKPPPHRH